MACIVVSALLLRSFKALAPSQPGSALRLQCRRPLTRPILCLSTRRPQAKSKAKQQLPDVEELLAKRDYVGALALLQFKRQANREDVKTLEWIAYCHFHYGEHDKALHLYKQLLAAGGEEGSDPLYHIYAAACYYYMGLYREAEEAAGRGPPCALRTRILFHAAHRLGDEAKLMAHHQQLTNCIEDQLTLASIHYERSHFQVNGQSRAEPSRLPAGRLWVPPAPNRSKTYRVGEVS